MTVVLELQAEIKSLGRINASLVDSNRQLELRKEHHIQKSNSKASSQVRGYKTYNWQFQFVKYEFMLLLVPLG